MDCFNFITGEKVCLLTCQMISPRKKHKKAQRIHRDHVLGMCECLVVFINLEPQHPIGTAVKLGSHLPTEKVHVPHDDYSDGSDFRVFDEIVRNIGTFMNTHGSHGNIDITTQLLFFDPSTLHRGTICEATRNEHRLILTFSRDTIAASCKKNLRCGLGGCRHCKLRSDMGLYQIKTEKQDLISSSLLSDYIESFKKK